MKRCIVVLFSLFCLLAICSAIAESNADLLTPQGYADVMTYDTEGFSCHAKYDANTDVFTYILYSTDISNTVWKLADESAKYQYHEIFSGISASIEESLNTMGCADTCNVCIFKLSDGTPVYLVVNGNDLTDLL